MRAGIDVAQGQCRGEFHGLTARLEHRDGAAAHGGAIAVSIDARRVVGGAGGDGGGARGGDRTRGVVDAVAQRGHGACCVGWGDKQHLVVGQPAAQRVGAGADREGQRGGVVAGDGDRVIERVDAQSACRHAQHQRQRVAVGVGDGQHVQRQRGGHVFHHGGGGQLAGEGGLVVGAGDLNGQHRVVAQAVGVLQREVELFFQLVCAAFERLHRLTALRHRVGVGTRGLGHNQVAKLTTDGEGRAAVVGGAAQAFGGTGTHAGDHQRGGLAGVAVGGTGAQAAGGIGASDGVVHAARFGGGAGHNRRDRGNLRQVDVAGRCGGDVGFNVVLVVGVGGDHFQPLAAVGAGNGVAAEGGACNVAVGTAFGAGALPLVGGRGFGQTIGVGEDRAEGGAHAGARADGDAAGVVHVQRCGQGARHRCLGQAAAIEVKRLHAHIHADFGLAQGQRGGGASCPCHVGPGGAVR